VGGQAAHYDFRDGERDATVALAALTQPLRLAVLDQSPIPEGGTGAQALRNTIDLARLAEELGYGRYWVAEHHGTPMLACAAPEILIAAIAAATASIRVGSGGVALPHYSPFKVAEAFSVLGGIHGKRIDLGVGRAPGSDLETIAALQRDRRQLLPDDFLEQLAELLAYFEDGFAPEHPFARLSRLPGAPGTAEVWLLGTSLQSAAWAAELGLPYAVADFINPASASAGLLYRERFTPSPRLRRARVLVAVGVVCAETDEEAERQASSWRMAITLAERGRFGALPTVTRALGFLAGESGIDTFAGRRVVVGSPDRVRPALEQITADYGADELMIHTMTHNHAARRRSYELLAEAFGLKGRAGERAAASKRR
jgi:luciferase family oxidoreductase group 1